MEMGDQISPGTQAAEAHQQRPKLTGTQPELGQATKQHCRLVHNSTIQYTTSMQPVCQLYVQVLTCYHPEDGGFGASPRNDSHMLATLSALQILVLLDELHRVEADRVVACE
jgi:prenyltransferase beta subunit